MSSTSVNVRLDKEIKKEADQLFKDLGLNMSTAVNMFVRQAVREQRIPFTVGQEKFNKTTIKAMQEARDIMSGKIPAKRYTNIDELIADIEAL